MNDGAPTSLDELLAIEAIRRLKTRYCLTCDSHDWAGYRACFTDDAVVTGDLPVDGAGERPRYLADEWPERVARTLTMKSHHTVHQSLIEITSPTTARGLWAYTQRGFAQTGGFYLEEYRKDGGAWRISALRIVAIHGYDPAAQHSPPGSFEEVAARWDEIRAFASGADR
ncbi:MAG: nuclear transport factor 2 family protein [Actinobacteria bacterium]|nr:nuclear transport factor 2 family protein [Actinomycetota bacterium]